MASKQDMVSMWTSVWTGNEPSYGEIPSGPLDATLLFLLALGYSLLFGIQSLSTVSELALAVLAVLSVQFEGNKQIWYAIHAVLLLLTSHFLYISLMGHLSSTSMTLYSLSLSSTIYQLHLNFRFLFFFQMVISLASICYYRSPFAFATVLVVAMTYFLIQSELVTRIWLTYQASINADLQRMKRKEEQSLEKTGAVANAVHRLFVKAFGNYDQFSLEVSKLVKEAQAGLSKENLKLVASKEVDFSAFELERKLASGGFCTVFRGNWKPDNRQCAVKSFSSADRLDTAGLRGLVKEVVILTTLNHKHIVKVFGYCWTPQVCLVMEYMPKGTLHDMLAYKSLTLSWESPLLSLSIQIADAISYLHTRSPPIIHRDIKARNILMKDFRTCKLADFGLTVEEGSHQARAGTLRYVAPEVVNRADTSQQNTTRADIWSFGVCLWEMATRAQFAGLPPSTVLFSSAPRTIFVSKLPYAIPVAVYDVLEECLRPNPESRTITATECYRRLKAALGTLETPQNWHPEDIYMRSGVPLGPIVHSPQFAPNDLSVDASMSWRADAMWRRNAASSNANATVNTETSRTLDDLSYIQTFAIQRRLGRAEANNSRQLAKLAEEIPPPPPRNHENLPLHERLSALSRISKVEAESREKFKERVSSRQLTEQSPLLDMDYFADEATGESEPEEKLVKEEAPATEIVKPPLEPVVRLGLLSRLALAESRTQDEAMSKFAASASDLMVMGPSNSRLLESLIEQHKEAEDMGKKDELEEEGAAIDLPSRLSLLARLADADTSAKKDLEVRVQSQRTLDESCPLLKVEFATVDHEEHHADDDNDTIAGSRRSSGPMHSSIASVSSVESRFLTRLGTSSNEDFFGEETSHGNLRSSGEFESRFLTRVGGKPETTSTSSFGDTITVSPSFDSLKVKSSEGAKEQQSESSGIAMPGSSVQQDTQPQVQAPKPPIGNNRGLGLLSRLAQAEAQASTELEVKIKQGRTSVSSSLLSLPIDQGPPEEEEDEEDISEEERSSSPSSCASTDEKDAVQSNGTAAPPIIFQATGGLLSRLAEVERLASSDLQERVKTGRTNVSSSLLSLPIVEPLVEEEGDSEDSDEPVSRDPGFALSKKSDLKRPSLSEIVDDSSLAQSLAQSESLSGAQDAVVEPESISDKRTGSSTDAVHSMDANETDGKTGSHSVVDSSPLQNNESESNLENESKNDAPTIGDIGTQILTQNKHVEDGSSEDVPMAEQPSPNEVESNSSDDNKGQTISSADISLPAKAGSPVSVPEAETASSLDAENTLSPPSDTSDKSLDFTSTISEESRRAPRTPSLTSRPSRPSSPLLRLAMAGAESSSLNSSPESVQVRRVMNVLRGSLPGVNLERHPGSSTAAGQNTQKLDG